MLLATEKIFKEIGLDNFLTSHFYLEEKYFSLTITLFWKTKFVFLVNFIELFQFWLSDHLVSKIFWELFFLYFFIKETSFHRLSTKVKAMRFTLISLSFKKKKILADLNRGRIKPREHIEEKYSKENYFSYFFDNFH